MKDARFKDKTSKLEPKIHTLVESHQRKVEDRHRNVHEQVKEYLLDLSKREAEMTASMAASKGNQLKAALMKEHQREIERYRKKIDDEHKGTLYFTDMKVKVRDRVTGHAHGDIVQVAVNGQVPALAMPRLWFT